MRISEQKLKELQLIYSKRFGKMTDEQTCMGMGIRVLTLMRVLTKATDTNKK